MVLTGEAFASKLSSAKGGFKPTVTVGILRKSEFGCSCILSDSFYVIAVLRCKPNCLTTRQSKIVLEVFGWRWETRVWGYSQYSPGKQGKVS